MRLTTKWLLVYLLPLVGTLLIYCHADKQLNQNSATLPYKNLHDTVKYVGAETCKTCHQNIYDSFMRTGMGQSFHFATQAKSAAQFGKHIAVYDSINNLHYYPFWRQDSLFIAEYRLLGKDTLFKTEQYIRYIIGSGQHTNSHIIDDNGHLYQAPITFYTQKGIWDLAPGFEGGFSSRFNRIIGLECMSCHNALPDFDLQSENKFHQVPLGISCERCHGPGEVHVHEKMRGLMVDTATQIDYTIVNPRKLPTRELQMNVCQRCHLQGISVLKEGKDFPDFKPGMPLTEVMDIFLPEFDGNQTKFIMASQAHRLTKSACYQKSNMTCLSCHNPHVSVKETPLQTFNNACINCHNPKQNQPDCTLPLPQRTAKNQNNCSGCHMQVSGSIDIPHVTIHDHYIRKPINESDRQKVENFIGLIAATGGNPGAHTKAKAYLHYFESYTASPAFLDSALALLSVSTQPASKTQDAYIHAYYLQQNYTQITQLAAKLNPQAITDPWTAYRTGEAFMQTNKPDLATPFLAKAVTLLPLMPDFALKLSICYMQQQQFAEAKTTLEQLIKNHPNYALAYSNLGFAESNLGNFTLAQQLYLKALALNPMGEQAMLNLAALHLLQLNTAEAKKTLARLLLINPQNQTAQTLWKQLVKQ
ncbi:MAG TPA: tetratricopeptide repeat protein [Chitinophagales bacterium]|nr:tetratricopeptide repeat protein [Chitinophagales bacterium]